MDLTVIVREGLLNVLMMIVRLPPSYNGTITFTMNNADLLGLARA